jgi:hypothetical protein
MSPEASLTMWTCSRGLTCLEFRESYWTGQFALHGCDLIRLVLEACGLICIAKCRPSPPRDFENSFSACLLEQKPATLAAPSQRSLALYWCLIRTEICYLVLEMVRILGRNFWFRISALSCSGEL